MRGACTCLHLRRQVQIEQEAGCGMGEGGKEAFEGAKQKRRRKEADSKQETSSVMDLI